MSEDKQYLPKSEVINTEFEIYSKDLNELKTMSDKYCQTMKTFKVRLISLTAEELKTCIEYISRFENSLQLELRLDSLKTTEPIDDCLSLIGQKCCKLLKLDLRIHESIPISDRFFATFPEFKAIKKLRIDLPHDLVFTGSVECFDCKQPNELHIDYNGLTEDFFTEIASHLPKLRFLYIYTIKEYFVGSCNSFLSMKNIQKIENNSKKSWYFGKCLTEVKSTPKGKDVYRFNDNCGLIYE